MLLLLALSTAGCTRGHYRTRADEDAYRLIDQKRVYTRPLARASIDVDPRSRMFDPSDPDYPLRPPDDPAAHVLMHHIDGKSASKIWDKCYGTTPFAENPDWSAFVPKDEDGALVLDAREAIRVGLLHSTEFQGELEDLYLSSLDVSFERFRFDSQFFGGYEIDYFADGRLRDADGESSSVLTVGTFPTVRGIRMEKLLATGGELVVGLANRLVWQFSGPDEHTATTLIDFSLVQPLLRGGGRAVVLERLTIAERRLLANVRQMERFRRGFYIEVITGRDAGPGPSRAGGVFGGTGLQGFAGTGGGGFGQLGNTGGGFAGGAGAAQAGGYIGLLQDQQNIRNQIANIASLRSSLAQLEAFFEAGRIDFFQVELARQALLNGQSRLLTAQTGYQATLDGFKIDLGLPPSLDVKIEDDMLDQFNLIDPEGVPAQNQLTAMQRRAGVVVEQILTRLRRVPAENIASAASAAAGSSPAAVLALQLAAEKAADEQHQAATLLRWNEVVQPRLNELQQLVRRAQKLRTRVAKQSVARAEKDIEALEEAIPKRKKSLAALRQLIADGRELGIVESDDAQADGAGVDPSIFDTEQLEAWPARLRRDLSAVQRRLATYRKGLEDIEQAIDRLLAGKVPEHRRRSVLAEEVLGPLPQRLQEMTAALLELTLVQARARTESITLAEVDLDGKVALQIAAALRRDWMNARANLVDAWRLIEFNANDLKSGLDVVFSGDISNTGDNPIRLRGPTGRLRVGLQFDAPLTRLAERNTYRQALIEYQQARRSYYTFIDQVSRGLRNTLRTIQLNKVNFELRRAAVHTAIAQVELTQLRLQEPPKPGVEQAFGATTARDLVSALADLLNAQNDFLSVWVNYEVLRRTLDFDLGTMELDHEGFWIDPGTITAAHGGITDAELEADVVEPELLPPPGAEGPPLELNPPAEWLPPPAGAGYETGGTLVPVSEPPERAVKSLDEPKAVEQKPAGEKQAKPDKQNKPSFDTQIVPPPEPRFPRQPVAGDDVSRGSAVVPASATSPLRGASTRPSSRRNNPLR